MLTMLIYTLGGGGGNTIKENTEALLEASRKAGLEVNTEKTKNVIVSRHQNTGQNCNLLIANKSLENVANFKFFGSNSNEPKLHSRRK
jgi:hypothetical protein